MAFGPHVMTTISVAPKPGLPCVTSLTLTLSSFLFYLCCYESLEVTLTPKTKTLAMPLVIMKAHEDISLFQMFTEGVVNASRP